MRENILQAYRDASQIAALGLGIDAEVEAYKKVIDIGRRQNNPDDKLAQTVMSWAYNNIQDVFLKNESPKEWLKVKLAAIEQLPSGQKRKSLQSLADDCPNEGERLSLYEKALEYALAEDVPFAEKCKNILDIGSILKQMYLRQKDLDNFEKIKRLIQKTAVLAVAEIEADLDVEESREKKLQLFSRLFELEDRYLFSDISKYKCMLRRLNDFLNDGEFITANGKTYNKKTILDFLRRNALQ